MRRHPYSRLQIDGHQYSLDVKVLVKYLLHARIPVKVDIGCLDVTLPAKFLHEPCLADLPGPFQDKRLPA